MGEQAPNNKKTPLRAAMLAHVAASRRAPHTNKKSPVRKPGISYAEVSLCGNHMMLFLNIRFAGSVAPDLRLR